MELTLDNRIFRAAVVPEIGGNVISLRHIESNTPLLREPGSLQELRQTPEQFGIPVLFPPNRIADGKFTFEGRPCRLPVNETAFNNHLHGLAVGKPWRLTGSDDLAAELQFTFSSGAPEYEGFPFAFTLIRRVELTLHGLRDSMTVTNQGRWNMPLGLGYHTTFPAPEKVRLGTAARQFEIGERYLPTGNLTEWTDFDPRSWFDPNGRNVGFHTPAEPLKMEDGTWFSGAELRYPSGLLRYRTDARFSFWYTWNRRGQGDFISLEPVSWMANALNQNDAESAGIRILEPGGKAVFINELVFIPKQGHDSLI